MQKNYLKSVGLLGASQIAGGLLGFCFTVVTARTLSAPDFGLFQALLGIFGLVSFIVFSLQVTTLHYVGASPAGERPLWAGEFLCAGFFLACAVSLVFFVLSPWLMKVLKSSDYSAFLALDLLLFLAIPLSVFYGIFYSHHRYRSTAAAQIVESSALLLSGILLLKLGWNVTGAVSAYLGGRILVLGYCLSQKSLYRFPEGNNYLAGRKGEFLRMMAAFGVLFSIIHLPMVAARIRLTAEMSGTFGVLYHLRSTVWPLALSVAMPFYAVTVSGGGEQKKMLVKALVLVGLLSLGFIAVGKFFPELLISGLYGEKFLGAAPFMPFYGLSLFLQMSLMIFVFRDMAQNRFRPVLLSLTLGILAAGLCFSSTVPALISAQIAACAGYFLGRLLKR